jgi:hypothetical protein
VLLFTFIYHKRKKKGRRKRRRKGFLCVVKSAVLQSLCAKAAAERVWKKTESVRSALTSHQRVGRASGDERDREKTRGRKRAKEREGKEKEKRHCIRLLSLFGMRSGDSYQTIVKMCLSIAQLQKITTERSRFAVINVFSLLPLFLPLHFYIAPHHPLSIPFPSPLPHRLPSHQTPTSAVHLICGRSDATPLQMRCGCTRRSRARLRWRNACVNGCRHTAMPWPT